MKLDRRAFIKFAVGTVAGVHLTPLPWKLIDDIAIWTQNWPWVPRLAKYADLDYVNGLCTMCEGGCGVKVRLADKKKSIKVEGAEGAPVNQGGVCPLGAAGPQYEYSLARFQSPLRRIGARGSGAFAKITWTEALQEVSKRLAELREQGQAHTVAMVSGRRHTVSRVLAQRFMQAYGSPNLIDMPSLAASREFADQAQFGRPDAVGYDLENSDFILSFGCGLIEGWGSPVRSIKVFSAGRGKKKVKFVQIDNRASLTASKADRWLAVAPGSEAALALGLAHVIIKGGLYDQAFVADNTFGFEEFKAMVLQEYDPGKVSALTGLPASDIIALAKEFAQAPQAVAIAGKGKGDMPTPVYEIMAVQALNALVGAVNRPGGVIVKKDLPLADWPEFSPDDVAKEGLAAPRLDQALSERHPLSGSLLNNFAAAVDSGSFYPVNLLIVDRANPAYFGADPAAFRSALDKVPFIVSVSGMADDTSVYADIVLPECANFEGPVDVVNPPTLPYPLFGYAEPVLAKPYFDTKPAGDIYIGLAKALGESIQAALPFKDYRQAVMAAAKGLLDSGRGRIAKPDQESDLDFGKGQPAQAFDSEKAFFGALAKGNFWFDDSFTYGSLEGAFQTASGRFEFLSQNLKAALAGYLSSQGNRALIELGVTRSQEQVFMPHYEPYLPPAGDKAFPLLLMPVEQFKLVNSSYGNAPYLTKLLEDITLKGKDLVVEINPTTAAYMGLKEGDNAWLQTPKGKLAVKIHLFHGARPDVVYAPLGLGHAAFDLYLRGKGVNPMEIVEATADPLSGQALWWGTRANMTKV